MGVKSTVTLTRAEAEQKWLDLLNWNAYASLLASFSNKDLEEVLEQMNDKLHGGEGLENYLIK